jgi:GTP1/Obg family GTP-binding protein
MNIQLETEVLLRKKLQEHKKKSAARKKALKELEKAFKIRDQALSLSVNQNLKQIEKIQDLREKLDELQSAFKQLQEIEYNARQAKKSWWKFWA